MILNITLITLLYAFLLSHLLLLLSDKLFCVFLIVSSSFTSTWVAFTYVHTHGLICPSWFALPFTTGFFSVFFSFVSYAVLCNFLSALCVYMNSGFSITFYSSCGIPAQMMTFEWYQLQCWNRKKREKEVIDLIFPTVRIFKITVNCCVGL